MLQQQTFESTWMLSILMLFRILLSLRTSC